MCFFKFWDEIIRCKNVFFWFAGLIGFLFGLAACFYPALGLFTLGVGISEGKVNTESEILANLCDDTSDV